MKKEKSHISYVFLLFLLIFAVFLVYGTRQGFYWDDWSQLLVHEKYGDNVFWEYFSYDRPASAWTHVLFFKICGNSPLKWHLLFSCIRFAGILLTYKLFIRLFPTRKRMCELSGVFLAVIPLFTQTNISIAYSQHFLDYLLFIASVDLLLVSATSTNKAISFISGFFLLH